MKDYRNLIIKGIREAVPRVNNMKKAFCGEQEKDESPTACMARLRNNIQLYSVIDLDSEGGKTMLKVHFVLHSWPDIRRKLEKLEKWPERELDELLEEAQKAFVRRDEERMKAKSRIMNNSTNTPIPNPPTQRTFQGGIPQQQTQICPHQQPRVCTCNIQPTLQSTSIVQGPKRLICTYCNKQGHGHWYCFKRQRDQGVLQMEGQILNN